MWSRERRSTLTLWLFSFQHVPTFAVTYQRKGWGPSLSCHPTKHQQWFFCVSVAKCRGKKAQNPSQSVDGGSEWRKAGQERSFSFSFPCVLPFYLSFSAVTSKVSRAEHPLSELSSHFNTSLLPVRHWRPSLSAEATDTHQQFRGHCREASQSEVTSKLSWENFFPT